MKVLIVEDEATSALLMRSAIASTSETVIATDGKSALEVFKNAFDQDHPFDCIILDLELPEMDGLELLNQLRRFEESRGLSQNEGTPVLVVSAHDEPGNVHQTLAEGAVDFISKPISMERFKKKFHWMTKDLPWGNYRELLGLDDEPNH